MTTISASARGDKPPGSRPRNAPPAPPDDAFFADVMAGIEAGAFDLLTDAPPAGEPVPGFLCPICGGQVYRTGRTDDGADLLTCPGCAGSTDTTPAAPHAARPSDGGPGTLPPASATTCTTSLVLPSGCSSAAGTLRAADAEGGAA